MESHQRKVTILVSDEKGAVRKILMKKVLTRKVLMRKILMRKVPMRKVHLRCGAYRT